eukprot:m.29407 g.29407  ORF g.29407 m.29407 type:complete len:94 (-) comp13710_c0_seq1:1054-1335(-)
MIRYVSASTTLLRECARWIHNFVMLLHNPSDGTSPYNQLLCTATVLWRPLRPIYFGGAVGVGTSTTIAALVGLYCIVHVLALINSVSPFVVTP